jgi:hypothetical protein
MSLPVRSSRESTLHMAAIVGGVATLCVLHPKKPLSQLGIALFASYVSVLLADHYCKTTQSAKEKICRYPSYYFPQIDPQRPIFWKLCSTRPPTKKDLLALALVLRAIARSRT